MKQHSDDGDGDDNRHHGITPTGEQVLTALVMDPALVKP